MLCTNNVHVDTLTTLSSLVLENMKKFILVLAIKEPNIREKKLRKPIEIAQVRKESWM